MQETTYTYNTGARRSIGGKKGFGPRQETTGSLQKNRPARLPKQFSHSYVEIIMPSELRRIVSVPAGSEKSINLIKETSDPTEDAPPDELDEIPATTPTTDAAPTEDFDQIEEDKELEGCDRKIRETFVKSVGDSTFKRDVKKEQEASKISKSLTCTHISEYQLQNFSDKMSEVVLKESKSPDPFESTRPHTESRLIELINSTTGPSCPLQELKKSGNKSSSALRAYKHFIISLFESASFMRKMIPITEADLIIRKLSIPRPLNVTCIILYAA